MATSHGVSDRSVAFKSFSRDQHAKQRKVRLRISAGGQQLRDEEARAGEGGGGGVGGRSWGVELKSAAPTVGGLAVRVVGAQSRSTVRECAMPAVIASLLGRDYFWEMYYLH